MENLDWVTPGVHVLVYSRRADHVFSVHRTMVARVNKATFTVARETEPRFHLNSGNAQGGSAWDSPRRVVLWGSDEAESVLAALNIQRVAQAARNAAEVWIKNPTRANRLVAIRALEAIRADKD